MLLAAAAMLAIVFFTPLYGWSHEAITTTELLNAFLLFGFGVAGVPLTYFTRSGNRLKVSLVTAALFGVAVVLFLWVTWFSST